MQPLPTLPPLPFTPDADMASKKTAEAPAAAKPTKGDAKKNHLSAVPPPDASGKTADKPSTREESLQKAADDIRKKAQSYRPNIEVDSTEMFKIEEQLGEAAASELRGLNGTELRMRIAQLSEHEMETEQAKAKDQGLIEAMDKVKELKAPYNETIKYLKLRRRLCVMYAQERGREINLAREADKKSTTKKD